MEDSEAGNGGIGKKVLPLQTLGMGNSDRPDYMVFGGGYLGRAVIERGLGAGRTVGVLTRDRSAAESFRSMGCQPVLQAALESDGWHAGLPEIPPVVINCVGSGKSGIEGYRTSYLEGMRSLSKWAKLAQEGSGRRGGVFVYTGSIGIYGDAGGGWVDESAARQAGSERVSILLETEEEVERRLSQYFDCWFILRLAGIYGPGRAHLLERVRGGRPFGTREGQCHLNLIHRDDAVEAIWQAIHAPPAASGVYNISDGAPAPRREVFGWLCERMGVSAAEVERVEAPQTERITADRRVSNNRARRLLGWNPRFPSYREGYGSLLDA